MKSFKEDKLSGASVTMEIRNDHSDIIIYSKNKELIVDSELEALFLKRIERNIEKLGKKANALSFISILLVVFICGLIFLLKKPVSFILLASYATMYFLYVFGLYGVYKPADILKRKFALQNLLLGAVSAVVTCALVSSDAAIKEGIISLIAALLGVLFAITKHLCDKKATSIKMAATMNRHMLEHPINIIIKTEELQWKQ